MSAQRPRRVQLSRTKGWRMPPNTVSVARPTRWGNPFTITSCLEAGFARDRQQAHQICVNAFRDWLHGNRWADGSGPAADLRHARYVESLHLLTGKNLACWCPLEDEHGNRVACHADVLLEVVNT